MDIDTVVRQAARNVGMNPEDNLLEELLVKLRAEFVVHSWQLSLLDSSQWKALGAPMGLSVAITHFLTKKQRNEKNEDMIHDNELNKSEARFSSGLTSRSSVAISESDHRLSNNSSSKRSNGDDQHQGIWKNHYHEKTAPEKEEDAFPEEDDDDSIHAPPAATTMDISTSKTKSKCAGECVATCFYDMMSKVSIPVDNSCFVMSKTFDQALLHAKSGADLKAHTMFVIELSVVASALFLGAAIELWGAFPLDSEGVGSGSYGLAVAFNLTSSLLIISQLLCASAWIWSLRVISAVAPNKFHQYVVETRHFSDYINSISVFGFALFSLDLFLMLAGASFAISSNAIVNGLILGIVLLLFVAGFMMVHKITSFLGRVAYHGLLLTNQKPDPSSIFNTSENVGETSKQKEEMLHRLFERYSILNESKAMDAYCRSSSDCPIISRDMQY
eukprot:scaffold5380_cov131-Cylindrotheca_fusiformis.AAC.29